LRAERLSLIGAHMAVRIERDGAVTIFAGRADTPPEDNVITDVKTIDLDQAILPTPPASEPVPDGATRLEPESNLFATLLGWLQTLDSGGLDGQDLTEIGLKNGSIAVDNRR